ncbi:MAG: hypothetical protein R3B09_35045 [Nannocystaceae bacterium]
MPTEPPSPLPEPWSTASFAVLEDVTSIDAIINAVYGAVSFSDRRGPDEVRLRSLLVEGAALTKVLADGRCLHVDVDTYLRGVHERVARGELLGFEERELFRRTEVYGGIAHVFTTYEARRWTVDGESNVRGINSVQLRNDGRRWWVLTILWTDEDEGSPIPAAYLPRG